jgi:hypothetical protein
MGEDNNGQGLRQVADITANHGEVHIARGKFPGSLKRSTGVDHLEAYRRSRRHELACHGGHRFGTLAVD